MSAASMLERLLLEREVLGGGCRVDGPGRVDPAYLEGVLAGLQVLVGLRGRARPEDHLWHRVVPSFVFDQGAFECRRVGGGEKEGTCLSLAVDPGAGDRRVVRQSGERAGQE